MDIGWKNWCRLVKKNVRHSLTGMLPNGGHRGPPKSPFAVPETQSTVHRSAQRTALRRYDAAAKLPVVVVAEV